MNLILLFADDFISEGRVLLAGRRFTHVSSVHRAVAGDELTVGIAGGGVGVGRVITSTSDSLELDVIIDSQPPAPLPLTLVLALPRPKVLNRVIAAATSLGVKSIHLINAWKVEKSYWGTPRLSDENLLAQSILGLEQAKDTILPVIATHRLFRTFVEQELPAIASGSRLIVAHPRSAVEAPRAVSTPVTLVVGPEGGFIEVEIGSLVSVGAEVVHLGKRILRVETAVASLIGRMF